MARRAHPPAPDLLAEARWPAAAAVATAIALAVFVPRQMRFGPGGGSSAGRSPRGCAPAAPAAAVPRRPAGAGTLLRAMALQSLIALMIIGLVIARAVNVLV